MSLPWNSDCEYELVSVTEKFSLVLTIDGKIKFESFEEGYSLILDENFDGYEQVGLMRKFWINQDVSFSWNGPNMLLIHINGQVDTKGLCGNNNEDESDDMSAKNGLPGKYIKRFSFPK